MGSKWGRNEERVESKRRDEKQEESRLSMARPLSFLFTVYNVYV